MISVMVTLTMLGLQSARGQGVKDSEAAKARAKVEKMGVGRDARVEVRLRDNTRLKGYISRAGEDSFTITDSKMGTAQTLAYTDVSQVKKPGGLSTRALAIIAAVATVAVIVGVTVVKPVLCDGGAGC
jgi:hypothetical protein